MYMFSFNNERDVFITDEQIKISILIVTSHLSFERFHTISLVMYHQEVRHLLWCKQTKMNNLLRGANCVQDEQ